MDNKPRPLAASFSGNAFSVELVSDSLKANAEPL